MIHRPIHPFPARMAPEIAFDLTKELPKDSILLDPMMGSGTTLQIGIQNGCHCYGADVDPLAILISRTSLTHITAEKALQPLESLLSKCKLESNAPLEYWDKETKEFANFWFAEDQFKDLAMLSRSINNLEDEEVRNLYKVALSRCIITKEKGASLASDVSHAKPHKTKTHNDFDVITAFEQGVRLISTRVNYIPPKQKINLFSDDARSLSKIEDSSIDCIITSPPYLHAVDYFRGHRLSLIWLGYSLQELRTFRANSIGLQKNPEREDYICMKELLKKVGKTNALPEKQRKFLYKYVLDIHSMCSEFYRVLKKQRKVTVVIANAWSAGIEINNTNLIKNAARVSGLKLISETTRQIPANKRYLPPPEYLTNSALDKRMKTEAVLTFAKS